MTEYKEQLGKITDAKIGFARESSIFAFWLDFDFSRSKDRKSGTAQSLGPISLIRKDENGEEYIPAKPYALLRDILYMFNATEISGCRGKICYVIREHERGKIIGLRTPEFETNKTLLLEDYQDEE